MTTAHETASELGGRAFLTIAALAAPVTAGIVAGGRADAAITVE